MDAKETTLTAGRWLARVEQLALRQGVRLSSLRQKDGRDLDLISATAAPALPNHQLLAERKGNECLKHFLPTAATMIATDHVELRCRLVDAGFDQRPDRGTDYRRGSLPNWPSAVAGSLECEQIAVAVLRRLLLAPIPAFGKLHATGVPEALRLSPLRRCSAMIGERPNAHGDTPLVGSRSIPQSGYRRPVGKHSLIPESHHIERARQTRRGRVWNRTAWQRARQAHLGAWPTEQRRFQE